MENETRIKIYPEMQVERIQELMDIAKSNFDQDKLDKLYFKFRKIQRIRGFKQPLWFITSNIIIKKLLPQGNSSELYRYLEYHKDDKSLFFGEIKDCNLKRIKIEYMSPRDIAEFYEYARELTRRLKHNKGYPLDSITCHIFFEESRIGRILLDSGLVNKPDNVIVDINKNFSNSNIGFAAIRTVEDDKPFNKIIFFQKTIGTNNNKSYLHVVECGELLSENYKVRFENNQAIDYNWEIEKLLENLNYDMYTALFFGNKEKRQPIDIIKSGEIFKPVETKIGPNGSEIKPYNKYLEMKYKPFNIGDQTDNLDDDKAIKKHIERFMNTRNTIQNTLRNVHMAGGPTNTLLRMPYRCVDGVEIKPNLPANLVNACATMPRISSSKIKSNLTKAIREFVDKSIDESLEKI